MVSLIFLVFKNKLENVPTELKDIHTIGFAFAVKHRTKKMYTYNLFFLSSFHFA